MKLEDSIVVAGLLILIIDFIAPPLPSWFVVGIVLILIGLVTSSETLKKGKPEPPKKGFLKKCVNCGKEILIAMEKCPFCKFKHG
jgi:hypothetical protein